MKTVILTVIRSYRLLVSPILHRVTGMSGCRYQPSCSIYLEEAITYHGIIAGLRMGIVRLLRCNPWSSSGYDPVPRPKLNDHPGTG